MAVLPESWIVADRHSEVIERGQRVAVFGLEVGTGWPARCVSVERLPLS